MGRKHASGSKTVRNETPSQGTAGIRDITKTIAELEELSVAGLQAKWFETFNEAARSRNRSHLIKKLAWRLQEQAEGGLSNDALQKIDELVETTPTRQRGPRKAKVALPAEPDERFTTATDDVAPMPVEPRDPRLPAVGETITKVYKGETHEVRVLDDGFEWQGTTYKSLSKLAKAITGSIWNGYGFFGLLAAKVPTTGGEA